MRVFYGSALCRLSAGPQATYDLVGLEPETDGSPVWRVGDVDVEHEVMTELLTHVNPDDVRASQPALMRIDTHVRASHLRTELSMCVDGCVRIVCVAFLCREARSRMAHCNRRACLRIMPLLHTMCKYSKAERRSLCI